jgi:uncharacterized membrane protein YeaQ/YmgE (transglycosylase-associated protein family)
MKANKQFIKLNIMEIIVSLIIGAVAGWLGSKLFSGSSLGLIGNIVVGIVGGIVGNWLCRAVGFSLGSGIIGTILTGAIGAIIILAVINLLFKKK